MYSSLTMGHSSPVPCSINSQKNTSSNTRRTKTLLPTTAKLLVSKTIQPATVKANLLSQKNQQKFYYDLHSKPLSDLTKGDKVMFQCGKHWKPAVVDDICSEPQSYIITTPDGEVLRRNRKHLRPTQAISDDEDSIDIDIKTPIPGTQNIQDDRGKHVNQPLKNQTLRRSTQTIRNTFKGYFSSLRNFQ